MGQGKISRARTMSPGTDKRRRGPRQPCSTSSYTNATASGTRAGGALREEGEARKGVEGGKSAPALLEFRQGKGAHGCGDGQGQSHVGNRGTGQRENPHCGDRDETCCPSDPPTEQPCPEPGGGE